MKAIMISIKPKWVAKILIGEKTIEVRKKFPKDYKGWVYIYCSKIFTKWKGARGYRKDLMINDCVANGKVVARFYCNRAEEIKAEALLDGNDKETFISFQTETINRFSKKSLTELSCLAVGEMANYLPKRKYNGTNISDTCGYAIHISNLEIFDKPKELGEFMPAKWDKCGIKDKNGLYQCKKCPYGDNSLPACNYKSLTKAPQSYMFIEVEE